MLNDLYYILRSETCQSIHRALDVVLMAMDRHLPIKHTQISGSATLFYIVKGRSTINFGPTLKKHIIRTLLNGMSAHLSDDTMMRNGCLTLCQFSIPNDVVRRKRGLRHFLWLHNDDYFLFCPFSCSYLNMSA